MDGSYGLQNLVKLQPFAIGAGNIKVFAAFSPKLKEHRFRFDDVETGLFNGGKSFINIGHIKGDMVYMPIATAADLLQASLRQLV